MARPLYRMLFLGEVKKREAALSSVSAILANASAASKSAKIYMRLVGSGNFRGSGRSEKRGSNKGAWDR